MHGSGQAQRVFLQQTGSFLLGKYFHCAQTAHPCAAGVIFNSERCHDRTIACLGEA